MCVFVKLVQDYSFIREHTHTHTHTHIQHISSHRNIMVDRVYSRLQVCNFCNRDRMQIKNTCGYGYDPYTLYSNWVCVCGVE